MTLILNEIHIHEGLNDSFQVSAADRRITCDNKYDSTREKIFPINYLNATISYFGLAAFYKNGNLVYFSDWLPNFINQQAKTSTSLQIFSNNLRNELNIEISKDILSKNPSGFHICGYNNGLPDFWYISNIGKMEGFYYKEIQSRYYEPSSHFLGRDAEKLGWDHLNPNSVKYKEWFYRNGDIRSHALASEKIDDFMMKLLIFPDFKLPGSSEDYANYVKFKFEILSYIYKKFAQNEIIGRPIDVYVVTNKNIKKI